ncbi:MAG: nitrilase-related carbon-nitrogen hydrolase [Candidatus Dojkabacteria bacterium]|nr:MAG: nitrilase-related carbon-nitrogen hydrolase [Candidatus Dojkabacteria bacterium]
MNVVGAVLQYDCPESVELSIVKLEEMVARAKKTGAQLVVAPETSIGMFADVSKTGTDYLPFICNISKKYEVFLATSFYRKANDGNIYNQGYLINQISE